MRSESPPFRVHVSRDALVTNGAGGASPPFVVRAVTPTGVEVRRCWSAVVLCPACGAEAARFGHAARPDDGVRAWVGCDEVRIREA